MIEEIAHGGMGIIFKVRDPTLSRTLALKVLALAAEPDTEASVQMHKARFLEEAHVTAQLDHPSVVPVHNLGQAAPAQPYFTMKLVKGRDLKEIIQLARAGEDGWNLPRAVGVLVKVCQALAYAHAKGVIHRDLKPANVMVGRFGEVYVMDWGLAKVVGKPDLHDLRMQLPVQVTETIKSERRTAGDTTSQSPLVTMDGTVVGTPAYMPPEQAAGRVEEVDHASDIYSLGAILYNLLAGQAPYIEPGARLSPRTILARVLDGPPKRVHELNVEAPPELIAICEKAMGREKSQRYGSSLDLAEDLQAFLDHRVVRAYRTGAVAELRSWVTRNRGLATMGATALVALLVGVLGITWQWHRAAREAVRAEGEAQRAVRERERQRLYAYGSDMRAAQVALDEGNLAQARDLLLRHVPRGGEEDLRGIEWRYLWQQGQGEEVKSFEHPRSVNSVAWSADGRLLATGCLDHKIRMWDVASEKVIQTFDGPGPEDHVGQTWWGTYPWMGFTSDGRWFSAQSATGYTVWETSRWLPTIQIGEKAEVIAFSSGGHHLGAIKPINVAWIHETLVPELVYPLEGPPNGILYNPWLSRDASRCALCDGYTIELWNLEDSSRTNLVTPGKPLLQTGTMSPDGQWLAVGSTFVDRSGLPSPAELFFLDLVRHQVVAQFRLPGGMVRGMAFSPDSQRLATGAGGTQTIDLWATGTSNHLATLKGHADVVWGLAFSPDGRWLASAGKDGSAKIWDAALEQRAEPSVLSQTNLTLCGFTPDAKHVVAQTARPAFELRHVPTGEVVRTIEVPEAVSWPRFTTADFKDLRLLADKLRGGSNAVSRFLTNALSARTRELLQAEAGALASAPLFGAALADDLNRLINGPCLYEKRRFADVSLSLRTQARLREGREGEGLVRLNRYLLEESYRAELSDVQGEAPWVQAFPEQGCFLVQTPDGELRVNSLLTGERLRTVKLPDFLPGDGASPWSRGTCRLSADGHLLFGVTNITQRPWTGALYDLRDGRRLAVFPDLEEQAWGSVHLSQSVAFSPDGRLFAYPDTNYWIHIGDLSTQRVRTNLGEQAGEVGRLVFSPNGKLLASVGEVSVVRLWDVGSGRPVLAPLKGHKSTIHHVQFSPDGKTLLTASAGSERSIRFWNLASGQEILVLKDLTVILSTLLVAFYPQVVPLLSPDGDTLAWADRAGNIRFTALPRLEQIDEQIQTQTRTRPTAPLSRERPGDLEEALRHYAALLQQQPNDPALWQVQGLLLAKTNRWEEAVRAYTHALASAGTNADHVRIRRQVLLQRSDAFHRLNRPPEALADCQTLLETCPLAAVEASSLALNYCDGPVEQRDLERTRLFLQHAARLPLSNLTALANLGQACYRVGQFSNAVEHVLQSARLGAQPSPRRFFVLCLSYAKLGQSDKARDYYEKGVADLRLAEARGNYDSAELDRYKQMQAEAEQLLGLGKPK